MDTSVLVVLLLGLALGFAAGYAIARAGGTSRTAGLRADGAAARATAESLTLQLSHAREQAGQDADVLRALAPVNASLTRMQEHVTTLERERTEQFTALRQQLHDARRGEHELRLATSNLTGALRAGTTRGQWGEVALRRVLEASGMLRHVDFVEQQQLPDGGGRPDVVIHLPGSRHVVIDAKVPFDAYLEASAIADTDGEDALRERERLLAAHSRALRGHMTELTKRRYHEHLPASPELVVMFLPSEAVLAAALDADPTLLEDALQAGVAPASPASLLALLRTTAAVWASAEVTRDAKELLQLGRTLYSRLSTVSGHVRAMGRSLESSVQHYNSMVASLETRLLVTARQFEALDDGTLETPAIGGERAQVRPLTAAELLADPLEARDTR